MKPKTHFPIFPFLEFSLRTGRRNGENKHWSQANPSQVHPVPPISYRIHGNLRNFPGSQVYLLQNVGITVFLTKSLWGRSVMKYAQHSVHCRFTLSISSIPKSIIIFEMGVKNINTELQSLAVAGNNHVQRAHQKRL